MGIIYQTLLIFSLGMFLQSDDVFAEGFTNCLEPRLIYVMMNVYEIILTCVLKVVTNNKWG